MVELWLLRMEIGDVSAWEVGTTKQYRQRNTLMCLMAIGRKINCVCLRPWLSTWQQHRFLVGRWAKYCCKDVLVNLLKMILRQPSALYIWKFTTWRRHFHCSAMTIEDPVHASTISTSPVRPWYYESGAGRYHEDEIRQAGRMAVWNLRQDPYQLLSVVGLWGFVEKESFAYHKAPCNSGLMMWSLVVAQTTFPQSIFTSWWDESTIGVTSHPISCLSNFVSSFSFGTEVCSMWTKALINLR